MAHSIAAFNWETGLNLQADLICVWWLAGAPPIRSLILHWPKLIASIVVSGPHSQKADMEAVKSLKAYARKSIASLLPYCIG